MEAMKYVKRSRKRGLATCGLNTVFRCMLGREYKLGGDGADIEGKFDCLGMLVEYTKRRYKKDILSRIEQYTDDYVTLYKTSKDAAIDALKGMLDREYIAIVKEYKLPGDIVLAELSYGLTLGIYGGNSHMMITSEQTGCTTIGTNFYNIVRAYRWPL